MSHTLPRKLAAIALVLLPWADARSQDPEGVPMQERPGWNRSGLDRMNFEVKWEL